MNDLIIGQRVRKRNRLSRVSLKWTLPSFLRRSALRPQRPAFLSSMRVPSIRLPYIRLPAVPPKVVAFVLASAPLLVAAVAFGSDAIALRVAEKRLGAPEDPLFARGMMQFAETGSPIPENTADGDLPPLDLAETFRYDSYIVKRGDTVSSIAVSRSLTLGTVIAANKIRNVKNVYIGMELRIPNMDGVPYVVRKGDSLLGIASAWGIPMEAILDANDLDSATIYPGMSLFLPGARMSSEELRMALGDMFAYPVRGRLTSGFGWRDDPFTGARRYHAAIDLAAPLGTPIRAAMAGTVSSVGFNMVYGKYVIITHSGGYQTWYAHLDEHRTVKGKRVSQGELIGNLGNTGYSTGQHVHFAIFKNGRAVNPLRLLSRR